MKGTYYTLPGHVRHLMGKAFKAGEEMTVDSQLEIKIVVKCGDREVSLSEADINGWFAAIDEYADNRANRLALEKAHDLMKLSTIQELKSKLENLSSKIGDVLPELEHAIDRGFQDIHPDVYWQSSASQNC